MHYVAGKDSVNARAPAITRSARFPNAHWRQSILDARCCLVLILARSQCRGHVLKHILSLQLRSRRSLPPNRLVKHVTAEVGPREKETPAGTRCQMRLKVDQARASSREASLVDSSDFDRPDSNLHPSTFARYLAPGTDAMQEQDYTTLQRLPLICNKILDRPVPISRRMLCFPLTLMCGVPGMSSDIALSAP